MDLLSIFSLLGGLGLFLYGMKLMEEGLESVAGDKMRRGLEVLTKNRFLGVAVGAGVTAIIQSSSATTVMVVGFVNAGLMTLTQAISVNMGANIGTTVTAQILSFKITQLAPIVLFIGVILLLFFKKRSIRRIGQFIAGLGILFVGLELMSDSMAPLREWQPFINMLSSFSNPVLGILAGALVTAIIQSSSATMGILIALAGQGLIGFESSIYVVLGLNIGTCITALLACIGSNKTAKRTAFANLSFNVIGVLIFSIILSVFPVADWIASWTPGDTQRQMANWHTMFNVLTTLILVWNPKLLIKIASLIVRGEDKKVNAMRLEYIKKDSAENPSLAVGQAVREVLRMGDIATQNFKTSVDAFLEKKEELVMDVEKNEKTVNFLNREITAFLSKVSQNGLAAKDSRIVADLFHIVLDLERISDHAENVSESAAQLIDSKLLITGRALEEIIAMSDMVKRALERALDALQYNKKESAAEVIEIEKVVDRMEQEYKNNHVERLANGGCSPNASIIFTDLIMNFERVADHSTNIAYYVLDGDFESI